MDETNVNALAQRRYREGLVHRLDDLARRLDKLERSLKPGGVFVGAIGDTIGKLFSQWRREHEQRSYRTYKGVHDAGVEYRRGDVCTYSGCLWFCTSPTKGVPGKDVDWRLVAKSGDRSGGPTA